MVPSILDASRIQEPTPIFQYSPQEERGSRLSVPDTAVTASSRPSTISSVGSIPDFPLPQAVPMVPPTPPPATSRRTMGLGPPPSSRRGASSFYSTASFVSPIPEESPRTRSHTSYASSAAITESYGTLSPGLSPDAAYFDDTIAEESVYSDDADERGLVRSASIGRKGKPSLVTTRSTDRNSTERTETVPIVLPLPSRPKPKPAQEEPFTDGTGYLEGSSSSSSRPSGLGGPAETVTSAGASPMLGAFAFDQSGEPASIRMASPSPRPAVFSAIRRPPRLDMDAVRDAEARGSLTSLPDLIRRATRLASMIDKGKRPASGFNDLNFPPEMYGRDLEKDYSSCMFMCCGGGDIRVLTCVQMATKSTSPGCLICLRPFPRLRKPSRLSRHGRAARRGLCLWSWDDPRPVLAPPKQWKDPSATITTTTTTITTTTTTTLTTVVRQARRNRAGGAAACPCGGSSCFSLLW